MQLDDHDRNILDSLQINNRLTYEQIAGEVGLSATAVQRRIKKYREQKLIVGDVSVLDPKKAGLGITVIVEVTMAKGPGYSLEEFKRSVLAVPEISQCYHVTGRADFILIISARDMEDYEAFTQTFSTTIRASGVSTPVSL